MPCPMISGCAFFNDRMANMPSIANSFKKQYCNGDYQKCARYIVKQATGVAHPTLMPNKSEGLDAIIADVKAGKI